jgi:hypothetical protein
MVPGFQGSLFLVVELVVNQCLRWGENYVHPDQLVVLPALPEVQRVSLSV